MIDLENIDLYVYELNNHMIMFDICFTYITWYIFSTFLWGFIDIPTFIVLGSIMAAYNAFSSKSTNKLRSTSSNAVRSHLTIVYSSQSGLLWPPRRILYWLRFPPGRGTSFSTTISEALLFLHALWAIWSIFRRGSGPMTSSSLIRFPQFFPLYSTWSK